jgi:hypothetical protein
MTLGRVRHLFRTTKKWQLLPSRMAETPSHVIGMKNTATL